MTVHGLLLAAGRGARMGRPKALVVDDDGTPWLARSVEALLGGGCTSVTVVLGAAVDEALPLLPPGVDHVVADDWAEGMSASLRAGLSVLTSTDASAVLVSLVDLPDVGAEVVARVLASGSGPAALARATYDDRPGHPVLIGRDHWAGVLTTLSGDSGARAYLDSHPAVPVDCSDLATGLDVDRPG